MQFEIKKHTRYYLVCQTVDKKAKINSKKISFGFLNKKEKKENPKK